MAFVLTITYSPFHANQLHIRSITNYNINFQLCRSLYSKYRY